MIGQVFIIDEEMSKWIMEIKIIIIIIIIKGGEEKEERRRVNALLQGRLPGDIEMGFGLRPVTLATGQKSCPLK